MSDVFVDLRYRGLPLANRVRLTELADRELYLEVPAPMPVGTVVAIDGDERAAVGGDARVLEVFEQTAGSERPPGMRVRRLGAAVPPRSAPAAAATASPSAVEDPGTAQATEAVAPPLSAAPVTPVTPVTAVRSTTDATMEPQVADQVAEMTEVTEVAEVMDAVAPPTNEEILADPGATSRSIAVDGEVEEDGPAPSESPGATPRSRKRRRGNRR
jgi:hypothetical protein